MDVPGFNPELSKITGKKIMRGRPGGQGKNRDRNDKWYYV